MARRTVIAVSRSSSAKGIYPLAFGNTELPRMLSRRQYACSSEVDGVERIHQQRICDISLATMPEAQLSLGEVIQGMQIILFFFPTLPILLAVSAFCPNAHAYSFSSATFANAAYISLLSLQLSCMPCPLYARKAFSYNG